MDGILGSKDIFQVLQYKYIVVSAAQLIVDGITSELPAGFQSPTKWPVTHPFVAITPYEHKAPLALAGLN